MKMLTRNGLRACVIGPRFGDVEFRHHGNLSFPNLLTTTQTFQFDHIFTSSYGSYSTCTHLASPCLNVLPIIMPPFVARKRHRSPSPSSPPSKNIKKSATVFETIDDQVLPSAVQADKDFLDTLEDSGNSSLSDTDSSEFEDVLPRRKVPQLPSEDEHDDWEDALPNTEVSALSAPPPAGDLELTLDGDQDPQALAPRKKGPSKIERQIRIATHCAHVQFLMFHNTIRNAWACDVEVQKILLDHLSPTMRKAVEDWRRDCGGSTGKSKSGKMQDTDETRPSKRRKTNHQRKARAERDWGAPAERQENGVPNMSRGDPTIGLLKRLANYWRKRFSVTAPGLRKQGYKGIRDLEKEVKSFQKAKHDPAKHGERIAGLPHFRKLAKKCEGSRDVGAQLFLALLRALGIETRLVASLQPAGFGWSKGEEAPPSKKSSADADLASSECEGGKSDGGYPPSNSDSARLDRVAHSREDTPRKARGSSDVNDNRIALSDSSALSDVVSVSSDDPTSDLDASLPAPKKRRQFDKDLLFPNYWVEAISPVTHEVVPVDPMLLVPSVVTSPEQLSSFEPRGANAEKARQVLAYVIAHSSDGSAKDVTTRYLKKHMWPGKTKGVRMPPEKVPILNKHGRIKQYEECDWFKHLMSGYIRHERFRTIVDDIEDAKDLKPTKFEKRPTTDGEETLQGYKQSTEFVLERYLRREEAIINGAKPVKTFKTGKGEAATEEPVYRRKDMVSCKTEESWHKEGRRPRVEAHQQPLKWVPIRAVTITRKREIEEASRHLNGEKPMQGLYSKAQTEYIVPPPIEDGVIPKNKYGNIDCFVPSMVPKGAVHVPLRGTVRICKKLGIDYAEAVTGFEFGNRLAVPVVDGIVVACEHEHALIDAWEEEEAVKRVKEDEKRNKLILSTWRKFLMGLRIVERVREEYGDEDVVPREEINPFTNRSKLAKLPKPTEDHFSNDQNQDQEGGFLHEEGQISTGLNSAVGLPASPEPWEASPPTSQRCEENSARAADRNRDDLEDSESAYEESKHFEGKGARKVNGEGKNIHQGTPNRVRSTPKGNLKGAREEDTTPLRRSGRRKAPG